ncbi:MAG: hypothetical protein QNK62_04000 [Cryomorphaceae bacterium]
MQGRLLFLVHMLILGMCELHAQTVIPLDSTLALAINSNVHSSTNDSLVLGSFDSSDSVILASFQYYSALDEMGGILGMALMPPVHYRHNIHSSGLETKWALVSLGSVAQKTGVQAFTWAPYPKKPGEHPFYAMRVGPIPSVEWTYQGSQGRGQSFSLNATASENPSAHWNIVYGRLQSRGQLFNERYQMDRLTVFHTRHSKEYGWHLLAKVEVLKGDQNETGGVVDPENLSSSALFITNRTLVPTRWTDATSSGGRMHGYGQLTFKGGRSVGYEVTAQTRSYVGPTLGFSDTLRSVRQDISMYTRFPWNMGLQVGLIVRYQGLQDSNVSVGYRLDPYLMLTSNTARLQAFPRSGNFLVAYKSGIGRKFDLDLEGKRDYAPFWSGQEVLQPMQYEGTISHAFARFKMTMRGSYFGQRNLLTCIGIEDPGVWRSTPSSGVVSMQMANKPSNRVTEKPVQLVWRLTYNLVSADALMMAPWVFEGQWDRQWQINANTQFFVGVEGYAWAGEWIRPVYLAERGIFAYSPNSGTIAPNGLVTPFAGIRFKKEAEVLVKFQNANQGWIPNTIFLAENYPMAPAAVMIEGRWRMFN